MPVQPHLRTTVLLWIALAAAGAILSACSSMISSSSLAEHPPGAVLKVDCSQDSFSSLLAEVFELDPAVDGKPGANPTLLSDGTDRASIRWEQAGGRLTVEVTSMSAALATPENRWAAQLGQRIREALERKRIAFERVL